MHRGNVKDKVVVQMHYNFKADTTSRRSANTYDWNHHHWCHQHTYARTDLLAQAPVNILLTKALKQTQKLLLTVDGKERLLYS